MNARRPALCRLAFAATLCATLSAAQPNIVLILTDDLGYGDLSCYGSEFIDTPRIDQMATQGVRATKYRTAANILRLLVRLS